MKKTIITAALAIAAIGVFAQSVQETHSKWKKMSVPGVAITVQGDAKTAIKILKDEMKDEDIKVKASSKELSAEAINFKRISPNMMNLYATAEEHKDNTTTLTVFMARGTDASTFISSSTDAEAVNNLKNFLEQDVARNSLETSIKAQEKVVKDGENTLKNLEKKIENLKKDIKETEDKKAAQIETNKAAKETLDNLLKQRM